MASARMGAIYEALSAAEFSDGEIRADFFLAALHEAGYDVAPHVPSPLFRLAHGTIDIDQLRADMAELSGQASPALRRVLAVCGVVLAASETPDEAPQQRQAVMATEQDVREAEAAYGQTIGELVAEAERGYDPARIRQRPLPVGPGEIVRLRRVEAMVKDLLDALQRHDSGKQWYNDTIVRQLEGCLK